MPAPGPGALARPRRRATGRSSLDRAAYTAGVRADPRAHRGRRGLPGQPVPRAVRAAARPDPARSDVDALAALLARGNPAPYAGTVRLPGHGVEVATASPELFLRRDGDVVASGPIKGTGRTAADLLAKDRAENVMIVDLVRNDLGRVCATGTVTVPALCAVEEHPGLVHLVSTVRGELRRGRRAGRSCWPPPSRPARSPARPSPAPCGSSTRWRPPRAAPTAAASAGSTPTGGPASWPSASARSGSTGPPPAARCCASAPAPGSPGAPTRSASGRRPN